ncbi:hypothetical protein E3T26_12865 [Cryobacterium sp. TMT1-21]|uniref:hypothetical protein n=1 Tax=Cryobacterium sp. TMT1-21 TaxID=1259234 RepID=UPI00106BCA6D|nr:hypothetical protein [Cryobacterium sp. TMT1-21]TFD11309.1 hypothetical protein E3T26_12865 [Cryobacterium sp. TMT1-21]
MAIPGGYFLIVGSRVSESVSSKLTATGVEFVQKSLDSGEGNWRQIEKLAGSDRASGAIITLNRRIYERMARDREAPYVQDILKQITSVPNLVLVHEAVYGGEQTLDLTEQDEDEWDGSDWTDVEAAQAFGVIGEEVRLSVNALFASHGISLSIYKRNAEASLLAVAFIDDQLDNLLFRIYIPAGRLFEDEGAQLISMFHDWLTSVKGLTVRKDGYQTANGRVIEFHSNTDVEPSSWSTEVSQFQNFVALIDNTEAAEQVLQGMGLESARAHELVAKYAKQARRLQLDVRYERQRKELAIREQFESELLDEAVMMTVGDIASIVDSLLPSGVTAQGQLAIAPSARPLVQINQQFIHRAEGIVAQNIAGNAILGTEAREIERLIAEHGDKQAAALAEALRELADRGAPSPSRVRAKQKIKGFLLDLSGSVEKAAITVLQKWVEAQLGL